MIRSRVPIHTPVSMDIKYNSYTRESLNNILDAAYKEHIQAGGLPEDPIDFEIDTAQGYYDSTTVIANVRITGSRMETLKEFQQRKADAKTRALEQEKYERDRDMKTLDALKRKYNV